MKALLPGGFLFLMQRIISYYRYLNLLSLDVALGATISAIFLARVFNIDVRFHGLLCLGLTVWLIYTLDHLVDASKLKHEASTERHRFHQQNFKAILILALIIFLSIIPLLFFVYARVLSMGLVLATMVVIYFFVQRRLGFLKELLGAVLYSVGVMLPVIALSELAFNSLIAIPSVMFFNTALINLVLFSWFDRDKDKSDDQPSLVTTVGDGISKVILWLLFSMHAGMIVYAFYSGVALSILLIFFVMYLVLFLVFIYANWFSQNDRYRLMGDAVFLFPIFYMVS